MNRSLPPSIGLALAVFAALSGQPAFALEDRAAPEPRNVVICLIDTCRADHLSVTGYDRPTTPFLEELAERGVVFERCYSAAPWTKPSVASIFTSLEAGATGMFELFDKLDPSYVTLAECLRDGGFYTAGFSANPLVGRLSNYNQGFRYFREAFQVIPGGDVIDHASGSAAALNRNVLPWLEKNDRFPYFLYVHSVDPHEEYEPAPQYLELFADPAKEAAYREQWNKLAALYPTIPGNHRTREHFEQVGVEIEPFIDYGMCLYDADIRANDEELGLLWDKLDELGQIDNTIFIVTADHGEEFFEHGGTSHGYVLNDELVHVPLIIAAPGLIPEGVRISRPVSSIDIFPTILDLAGIEVPQSIDGHTLARLLRDEKAASRIPPEEMPPVFAEKREAKGSRKIGFPSGLALSVVQGPWKLIVNFRSPVNRPMPRYELYDLINDPGERHNLAGKKRHIVSALEKQIYELSVRNTQRFTGKTAIEPGDVAPEILESLRALGYVK